MSSAVYRPGSLVGARVLRVNDPKLLTGTGVFVDDLHLPGMLQAAVVRSPVPHARVTRFDPSGALADPEVVDVITPALAAEGARPLPCVWNVPGQRQESHPVVPATTRYVGEPLGLVVASSRAAAEDAAQLVRIEFQELPAVLDVEQALIEGAPLLFPEWGTNAGVRFDWGDPLDVVESAMVRAPHVLSMRFGIQRQAAIPMETRGVVAWWNSGTSELTVWISTQSPHHIRDVIAETFGLHAGRVRVIAPDVGGGFGVKDHLYSDEALACLAALRLGVPVKWVEDRREHFLATVHARQQIHDARLSFDDDGRFVALHSRLLTDLGAHLSNVGAGPALAAASMIEGPYRFEAAGASITGVVTNKTPSGSYRGFGMPQAAWVRERLVEEAARRLGMDPAAIRRRNMIQPDEMPYTTRAGRTYESGDYTKALDRAVELVRSPPPPLDDGRRRGMGLCSYVEFTGVGPAAGQQFVGFKLNGWETAIVRMEPDGAVTLLTGVCPHGQGLETTLAQVAADALGVSLEDVRVVFGDTASAPYSAAATIASRSMTLGGAAVIRAALQVREKVLAIGAHMLEASPDDVEISDGSVRVRGARERGLPLRAIAENAWLGWDLPADMDPGLEAKDVYDPPNTSYSYATHAAAIAVDPETGEIAIERYVVVHDCGTIVNPMIVEGQIHGGVAQGLAGALLEEIIYSSDGQPLTTTFMDYLLPTSSDVPDIIIDHTVSPSPFIPGGIKGMGEGGTIAPAAVLGNALANAIPEIAHLVTQTPLSPPRVWEWMRSVRHDEP